MNNDNSIAIQANIQPIKINEGSIFSPINLADYMINPDDEHLHFTVNVAPGSLPPGLSVSEEGVISGKAERGTARPVPYLLQVSVTAKIQKWQFELPLHIYSIKTADQITKLREDTWQYLATEGILPESLEEILERPISRADIYYLLQRYATFTVWNAEDLRLADNGYLLNLADASAKFNVYDFEVCLVATPKELFSDDRTLNDAVKTARAMVREVHRRQWQVEFGGFDRMASAAWYEVKTLNGKFSHQMQVKNYQPSEVKVAETAQAVSK